MAKFSKEVLINRSPEEVYDFLISEDNFKLIPGVEEVEKDKEKGFFNIAGKEKIPLIGLEKVCYEIYIDEESRPSSVKFHTVDFMCSTNGHWRLSKEGEGTKLGYEVKYTVPGSFLGTVIDKLLMEKKMAKEADEYLSRVQLCLEKVGRVMTKDVVALDDSTAVSEVTKKMDETDTRYFPILKEGKVAGVVTDGDLLSKMYAFGPTSEDYPVKNIMTTDVMTIKADASVLETVETLRKNKIRRMPVVNEQGNLVGVISTTDLEVHLGMLTRRKLPKKRDY
ncbi:MAG TPA: CBS domain-containing protein [Actinobacteria bacterium]|nr:CBS domain-containing protein [Actinomycetota bacterium]